MAAGSNSYECRVKKWECREGGRKDAGMWQGGGKDAERVKLDNYSVSKK
jgi:hypothetical protein